MLTLKNVLIFLAGAAFFHGISHLLLPFYVELPLQGKGFTLTTMINLWTIIVSGSLTIALLWLASKLKG
jgi:hypothetical protein